MKKFLVLLLIFLFLPLTAYSKESGKLTYNRGIKYLESQKYSEAIKEFAKSPNDSNSMEKLVETYVKRGEIFFKAKEWGEAANDFRNALFYAHCYKLTEKEYAILAKGELDICYKKLKLKNSPQNHYRAAKILEKAQVYPASIYEYVLASEDKNLKEACQKKAKTLVKLVRVEINSF